MWRGGAATPVVIGPSKKAARAEHQARNLDGFACGLAVRRSTWMINAVIDLTQ
jgi:hypothetical protein